MNVLLLLLVFALIPQGEDLRELSGLSQEDAASTTDTDSFDPLNPQFKKLLYRTGTVDSAVIREWVTNESTEAISSFATNPADHRFHPVSIDAKVKSIRRFDYPPEQARNFLSGFYVADCENEKGESFALISRSSVASWPVKQSLEEPQSIRFDGFFFASKSVALIGETDSTPIPILVTRRFSWHPERTYAELGVDAAKVALANSGVDISLLDIVKSRKGKSIGSRETVCFWQMLAASKNVRLPADVDRVDFSTMLRSPIESVGSAASVQGRVRQCVPVKVSDPEAVSLLGTDTWYQLTIFPDLKGRPIQVATRDGEHEVYQNAFPVTVCVLNLPAGLNQESIVGNVFLCDGFFYRIWAYPSERTDDSGLYGQPSPLVMASSLTEIESTAGQLQTMLGAMLLAMAIAIGFVGWFVFRSKKAVTRDELPDKIDTW
ncbi:hypothetical protein [Mariniblastus fucicola]|uniref:Uncharacterized protein n=1 Tax=Mariniblastus fucicola TaxID=980251 RepID=A0A5B9PQY3_9BACT|nr:hypothetical protein [Mariniblastus fucicola]QEG24723.1 hypothetical protein MFFC18_46450 [Mariniblastus fucicola]